MKSLTIFLRGLTFLALCILLAACDRPTPPQTEEGKAAYKASVDTCERLLGRKLTQEELDCVVVEERDGRIHGRIQAPLSKSLQRRQKELLEQGPPVSQPA